MSTGSILRFTMMYCDTLLLIRVSVEFFYGNRCVQAPYKLTYDRDATNSFIFYMTDFVLSDRT